MSSLQNACAPGKSSPICNQRTKRQVHMVNFSPFFRARSGQPCMPPPTKAAAPAKAAIIKAPPIPCCFLVINIAYIRSFARSRIGFSAKTDLVMPGGSSNQRVRHSGSPANLPELSKRLLPLRGYCRDDALPARIIAPASTPPCKPRRL